MHRCTGLLCALVLMLSSAILFSQPTAVAQESSPVAMEATREPLFATTMAPADLPDGPRLKFEIWYATIEPDVEVAMEAELFTTGPGLLIEHVVAGELTLRVDGPLQVVRAGSVATPAPGEEVTPGTEVVLQAGDTALYAQILAKSYANRGAEPVGIVGGQLIDMGKWKFVASPAGYTVTMTDEWDLTESVEPGPMTLVLERVTLVPGAVLPAPPPGALRVMTSGLTVVYLPKASDGSISNLLKEPVVTYALTLLPAGSATGTPEATPNGTG
jgi:hypothetical protein